MRGLFIFLLFAGFARGQTVVTLSTADTSKIFRTTGTTNAEFILRNRDRAVTNGIWYNSSNGLVRFANVGNGLSFSSNTFRVDSSVFASKTFVAGNYANRNLSNLSGVAINTSLLPSVSDGAALGSTSKMWSDLFLATGGVLNWNNGTYTATQSGTTLTLSGALTVNSLLSVARDVGSGAYAAQFDNINAGGRGLFVRAGKATSDGLPVLTLQDYASSDIAKFYNDGINLSVPLAATLSATDATLTFSGAYAGNTSRTVGLNLANANTWTGMPTYAPSGSANITLTASSSAGEAGIILKTGASSKWQIGKANSGDNEDYLVSNLALGSTAFRLGASSNVATFGAGVIPNTSDGGALGSTTKMWSDLFLASGGVINWNNGTYTMTQSSGQLNIDGTLFLTPQSGRSPVVALNRNTTSETNTLLYSTNGDVKWTVGTTNTASENFLIKNGSLTTTPVTINIANDATTFQTAASGVNPVTVRNSHASNPTGLYIEYSGAAPNDAGHYFIQANDSGAARFYVYSNGGIANYSANNVNLSDSLVKRNITTSPSTWNKIKNLQIVNYQYKDEKVTETRLKLGVIAQQVESIAPEWVNNSGVFGKAPDGTNLKAVYESSINFGAIKALQEAQTRIESLEVAKFAINATTTALTKAKLNTDYANVPAGYQVICGNIAVIYVKYSEAGTNDVWLTIAAPKTN